MITLCDKFVAWIVNSEGGCIVP